MQLVWSWHSAPAQDTTPLLYRDPSKPVEERVQDLLARLTLEEKATLLNHKGPTVERFNIRADQWNQCLNGVKWDRPTTLFPICLAMAATWDTNLVQEIATVLSDEARAIYNGGHRDPNAPGEHKGLIYCAPVINIGRNPYWGRNHEAWGEDPYLTGRMAVAYVHGRLPHTVYATESQVPPVSEYDISKGFTYMYLKGAPLFAFGHGLSDTKFEYSNLRVALPAVFVDVQNVGNRAGDEVAQLYVHQVKSRVQRPTKELRGFARMALQPGEKKIVTFNVPAEKLAVWDETRHAFVTTPGACEVFVGASSADIRMTTQITVR